MKKQNLVFKNSMRGSALTELLLSLVLAAMMLPFILRGQSARTERAENIIISRDMETVRGGLEKYISENQKRLLSTIGRDITRIKISDLVDYGISENLVKKYGNRMQLRILKSADRGGSAVLQGILIIDNPEITPMRTREIANMGRPSTGYVDANNIYSTFGTWRAGANVFGGGLAPGLSEATRAIRTTDDYIWRLESDDARDATMSANLSMGGREIIGLNLIQSKSARFENILSAEKIGTNRLVFESRPEIDGKFIINGEAVVSGDITSDARNINVADKLTLFQDARFSSVVADELWTNNLNLSGLAVSDDANLAILSIGLTLDINAGAVNATLVNVGFSGSITPSLYIKRMIKSDAKSEYYWDLEDGIAFMSDLSHPGLNQLMRVAVSEEGRGTESYDIMSRVSANQNATVSDFINAIDQIKSRVTAKFLALGLE